MKILKILMISIICFSLQGCPGEAEDEPDNKIDFVNNYNENIYIFPRYSSSQLTSSMNNVIPSLRLQPNEKHVDNVFYSAFDSNRKLWILIYKQSTIDAHTWEEIKEKDLFDKRYELTLEELKALDYKIVYTGN